MNATDSWEHVLTEHVWGQQLQTASVKRISGRRDRSLGRERVPPADQEADVNAALKQTYLEI